MAEEVTMANHQANQSIPRPDLTNPIMLEVKVA